jgi:hypothetical protein
MWGEEKCIEGFVWENLRERDHSEDPDVVGKIIIGDVGAWTGSSCLGI